MSRSEPQQVTGGLTLEDQKLLAEIEKLREDVRRSRSVSARLESWIKVLGGLTLGAVGALSGYQINEHSKNQAQEEARAAKDQVAQQEQRREELTAANAALDEEVKTRRDAWAKAKVELAQLEQARAGLGSSAAGKPGPAGKASDDDARRKLEVATSALSTTLSRTDLVAPQLALVFAPDPGDDQVRNAAKTLAANGYRLGKREVIPSPRPPEATEVRYFRPEDHDGAEKLLQLLGDKGLKGGRTSFVVDPDIKRQRYFEVRLSKNAF